MLYLRTDGCGESPAASPNIFSLYKGNIAIAQNYSQIRQLFPPLPELDCVIHGREPSVGIICYCVWGRQCFVQNAWALPTIVLTVSDLTILHFQGQVHKSQPQLWWCAVLPGAQSEDAVDTHHEHLGKAWTILAGIGANHSGTWISACALPPTDSE